MGGRPSKPIGMIVLEGKNHITKREIAERESAESAMNVSGDIKETKSVKKSKVAHKEFQRLIKLYEQIGFVSALDEQIINRYCMAVSDLDSLRKIASKMEQKLDDLDAQEADFSAKDIVNLYKSINSVIGKIQAQEKQLLSYEDRLFLNPAGRLRSIPKKKPEQKEKTGFAAYKEKWNTR